MILNSSSVKSVFTFDLFVEDRISLVNLVKKLPFLFKKLTASVGKFDFTTAFHFTTDSETALTVICIGPVAPNLLAGRFLPPLSVAMNDCIISISISKTLDHFSIMEL